MTRDAYILFGQSGVIPTRITARPSVVHASPQSANGAPRLSRTRGNSIQAIPRNSTIISIAPDELRGRVEAFRSMLAGGGPPLGDTLNGALASVLGPSLALVWGAAACATAVSAVALTRKELRDPYLGSAVNPRAEVVEPPAIG